MNTDIECIKALIVQEFQREHGLGESTGGSGHLSFTSITRIDPGPPREVTFKQRAAIEVPFEIETYTETEFVHSTDEDAYYKHAYVGLIVLDAVMNVLDFHSRSP